MCIVVLAWKVHPDYPLVVAANRDEFHHRPAEAARWRGDLLCGLDLAAGGTWLGVSGEGRFAAVTNFREPIEERTPGARSRGMLPLGFLESGQTPGKWMRGLVDEQEQYGGFNLLAADGDALWYMSNRGAKPRALEPGIHAVSNGLLDTVWPKTERARTLLERALAEGAALDDLLALLTDVDEPVDEDLPDTGVGIAVERLVAPIFIRSAAYGTRCSTAMRQRTDGRFELAEQRYQPSGTAADAPQYFVS